MPKKNYILSVIIAITVLNFNANAQGKLIDALNRHLIALNTLNPDSSHSDLDSLKPYLSGKMVIGLGEATHGTHEFVVFKHRMLEFLVKEMGVKAFVIEDDFAAAQKLNNYIINNKNPIENGIDSGMVFGVWKTREMIALCNWLKAYNATQTAENRVRFFGCDMQYVTPLLTSLKSYLQHQEKFTPEMERALQASKKPVKEIIDGDTAKAIIKIAADQLSKLKFTIGDTALYNHYVCELQQFVTYVTPSGYSPQQFEWRDKCMAENIEWIYNYTGHKKIMVWAHNAHISKASGSMRVISMGENLANYFGAKYYAMGFDFDRGSMRSYNLEQGKYEWPKLPEAGKIRGSSGAIFAKCRVPDFIIDTKSASEADPVVAEFLNKDVYSISIGLTYNSKGGLGQMFVKNKLAQSYDAVIFIKDTTPVHNMNN
jgi:erythromycin esterase